MKRSRTLRGVAALAALALALAGCARAGDDEPAGDTTSSEAPGLSRYREGRIGEAATGEPEKGGVLRYAQWTEPRALDPATTLATGTTGGNEMLNIFDSLMRYDAETKEYVPQLAESLEPNDNLTVWTLTLREGVTFSNGKPLDAAAVKFSHERYVASKTAPEGPLWRRNVNAVEVVDPLTVRYTLNRAWAMFPAPLASGPGMIVSADSGEGESYTPIGAGPFVYEGREEKSHVSLKANPNYWAGAPHLDGLRFNYFNNPDISLDSLKSGGSDAILLREAAQIDPLLDENYSGFMSVVSGGATGLINAKEGRPGSDPRVRKAIQLGSNTEALAEQLNKGMGVGSPTVFVDFSRWKTETQGLAYDPEEATRLLDEAKADGYDGKLVYSSVNSPALRARGLAFKAQMDSIGFDVELDLMPTVADQLTRVTVQNEYDIAAWSHNFREADPMAKLFATLHSSGNQVYGSHTSPEMDALIESFEAAKDFDEQHAIMDKIQQQINEESPLLLWEPKTEFSAWNANVQNPVGTTNSMVFFGQAWLTKS